jgi:hypothetical protein
MGFLVEEKSKYKGDAKVDRLDLELLAIGKRCGLSFVEINEFRAVDLLYYVNAYTGTKEDKPKEATQADIDSFYAH